MQNLITTINKMKHNLELKNIKAITSSKYKTLSTKDIDNENIEIVKNYNYYVKLTKRVKNYINKNKDIIFEIDKDKYERTVCLIINLNRNDNEVFIPIDIRVITGDTKDTYMNCTYYNLENEATLYINEFSSGKPRNGYGKIILKNIYIIVNKINFKLDTYNHYSQYLRFNYITKVEGMAIPNKNIISQNSLNKLYRKYGFEIDESNHMKMTKTIKES